MPVEYAALSWEMDGVKLIVDRELLPPIVFAMKVRCRAVYQTSIDGSGPLVYVGEGRSSAMTHSAK